VIREPQDRLIDCRIAPEVDGQRVRALVRQLIAMTGLPATLDAGGPMAAGRLHVVPSGSAPVPDESLASLEIAVEPPWARADDVRLHWAGGLPLLYVASRVRPDAAVVDRRVGFDVLGAIEFLLEGEQRASDHRDALGRFRPSYSILDDLGLQYVAPVARYASLVASYFVERVPGLHAGSWEGATFLVALTHDLDGVFDERPSWRKARHLLGSAARARSTLAVQSGLVELARVALGPARLGTHRPAAHRVFNFDPWARRELDADVRATYHFFGDYEAGRDARDGWYGFAERGTFDGETRTLSDALLRLEAQGHEVGLHASVASFTDPERLSREAATVERAIGRPPASVRCHYLRFDQRRLPDTYASVGLRYDSSVGALGFPRGTSFPFEVPVDGSLPGRRIVEIPTVVMDDLLLKDWQLALSEELAIRKIGRILGELRDTRGAAAVLFHPDSIDKLGLLDRVVESVAAAGGRCVPVAEVGRQWEARVAALS